MLSMVFFPIQNKWKKIFQVVFFLAFFCILIGVGAFVVTGENYVAKFANRAQSTYSDFFERKGTFGYRLEDSEFRYELFKKYPILGAGFVPGKLVGKVFSLEVFSREDTRGTSIDTIDSGLITEIAVFGIVGILFLILFIVIYLKFIYKLLQAKNIALYEKNFIYASGAYFIAGILTFITLGIFTAPKEIILLSIVCAILTKINQRLSNEMGDNGSLDSNC